MCVKTISQIAYSATTTTWSRRPARPGTSSPPNQAESPQSAREAGPPSVKDREDWYNPFVRERRKVLSPCQAVKARWCKIVSKVPFCCMAQIGRNRRNSGHAGNPSQDRSAADDPLQKLLAAAHQTGTFLLPNLL